MTSLEPSSKAPTSVHRNVLYQAGEDFREDRALRLGAGLAYYAVVTIVPILVLMVGLAGLVVGEEAQAGNLGATLSPWLGPEVSQLIEDTIVSLDVAGSFANLTILSVAVLVFTASVLFVAWKDALNVIWHVEFRGGVKDTIRRRLFAFAVVGGLGALLIGVVLAETLLAMLDGVMADDPVIDTVLRVVSSSVPLILGTLLLGAIYRFGPDVHLSWRDIWPGTVLTMTMLLVVSWGYGVYVDTVGNTSAAGVASSAMLLIALVYVVAQIAMFGAEFIKVLSDRRQSTSNGSA